MSWGAWQIVRSFQVVVICKDDPEPKPVASWMRESDAIDHVLHLTGPFPSITFDNPIAIGIEEVVTRRWDGRMTLTNMRAQA